jgi:hypothetical protein
MGQLAAVEERAARFRPRLEGDLAAMLVSDRKRPSERHSLLNFGYPSTVGGQNDGGYGSCAGGIRLLRNNDTYDANLWALGTSTPPAEQQERTS